MFIEEDKDKTEEEKLVVQDSVNMINLLVDNWQIIV